jgi:hypothetical protein
MLVWFSTGDHLRSLDVAEACPENLHVWVRFERDITDLGPDMLALPIAIGPDEKDGSISCLSLNVTCYNLFILLMSAG